jgi:hypothetical protein
MLTLITFSDIKIAEDIITNLSGNNLSEFRDGLKYQTVILAAYAQCDDKNIFQRRPNNEYNIKFDYMYNHYKETGEIKDINPPKDYMYRAGNSPFNMQSLGNYCNGKIDTFLTVAKPFNDYIIKYISEHEEEIMPIVGIKTFGYNKNGEFGLYNTIPINTLAPESVLIFKSILKRIRKKSYVTDSCIINDYLTMVNVKANKKSNIKVFGTDYSALNSKDYGGLKYVHTKMYNQLTSDNATLNSQYNKINIQCKLLLENEKSNNTQVVLNESNYCEVIKSIIATFNEKEQKLYSPYYSKYMIDTSDGVSPELEYFYTNIIGTLYETNSLKHLIDNTANSVRTLIKIILVMSSITPAYYNTEYSDTHIDFTVSNNKELFHTVRTDLKKLGIVGFNLIGSEMAVDVARDISIITDDLSSRMDPPNSKLKESVYRLSRTAYSYYHRMKEGA